MCGRYQFLYEPKDEDPPISKEMLAAIDQMRDGEVFPSQPVLYFYARQAMIQAAIGSWGFRYQKKRVINARLETLQEKKMFSPYAHYRCVLPCNGYYEWKLVDGKKQKMRIHHPSSDRIYLAAIFNEYKEVCVLTKKAAGKLAYLHDRMPIILDSKGMQAYLHGEQGIPVLNSRLKIEQTEK